MGLRVGHRKMKTYRNSIQKFERTEFQSTHVYFNNNLLYHRTYIHKQSEATFILIITEHLNVLMAKSLTSSKHVLQL